MTEFVTVAKLEDIPEGEARSFDIEDRIIAILKRDDQLYAMDDMCPHMGASLSAGYVEGTVVACPWHAWRFDFCDGTWCDNPRMKIDTFPVRIEDGAIQVCLTPNPKSDD